MQINKMTTAVMVIGSIGVFALADGPVISDVVARQRWPWSKLVDIDYVLSCEPHERMEVAFTARNGTEPLNIPQAALSGDLRVVAPGPRRIILDPSKTEYAEGEIMTQFNVTLTPSPAPFYMVVDLTKSVGADGQVE